MHHLIDKPVSSNNTKSPGSRMGKIGEIKLPLPGTHYLAYKRNDGDICYGQSLPQKILMVFESVLKMGAEGHHGFTARTVDEAATAWRKFRRVPASNGEALPAN